MGIWGVFLRKQQKKQRLEKKDEEGEDSSQGTVGLKVLGYKAAHHRQRTGQSQSGWRVLGWGSDRAENKKVDKGLSDRLWI